RQRHPSRPSFQPPWPASHRPAARGAASATEPRTHGGGVDRRPVRPSKDRLPDSARARYPAETSRCATSLASGSVFGFAAALALSGVALVGFSRRPTRPVAPAGAILLHQLLDRLAHVLQVVEVAIDRGEADVGDLIDLLQLADDDVADRRRGNLRLAERQQLALDPRDQRVDLRLADRPLGHGDAQARAQLLLVVLLAPAALLHHVKGGQLDPLVGREALAARVAAPPAADVLPAVQLARIDHARIILLAVR